MTRSSPSGRPGRSARVSRGVAVLLATILGSGCVIAPGSPGYRSSGLPGLVLEAPETVRPFQEREAENLLEAARDALRGGEAALADERAARIVEEYPSTFASGPALLVRARALLELGRNAEARASLARYADLLAVDDPRRVDLRIFEAEAMLLSGDRTGGLRAILDIPSPLPEPSHDWALFRVRSAVENLAPAELRRLAESPEARGTLAAPILVGYARLLQREGERERAVEVAELVIQAGAESEEWEGAQGVIDAVSEDVSLERAEEERARQAAEAEERRRRAAAEEELRRQAAEEEARRRREAEEEARREEARAEAARRALEEAVETALPVETVGAALQGELPPLVVEPGTVYPFRESEAERLLREGQEALEAGRHTVARARAQRILDDYRTTTSSGPAPWLQARTARAAGDHPDAASFADRYAALMSDGDPRMADVRLFRAEDLVRAGAPIRALDSILALPVVLLPGTRARALRLVRELVEPLDRQALGEAVDRTRLGQPLAAPLMVAYGQALRADGEVLRGSRFGEAAIALGAQGPDLEAARLLLTDVPEGGVAVTEPEPTVTERVVEPPVSVDPEPLPEETPLGMVAPEVPPFSPRIAAAREILRGRMVEGDIVLSRPASLGMLLPRSGSPTMRRFAEQVEEGVLTAIAEAGSPELLSLDVVDDGGRVETAMEGVRDLRSSSLLGILGPLDDQTLLAASDAAGGDVPIVSPTARSAWERDGVYTLSGPDPEPARSLARYAASAGFEQVVVVHPNTELRAFEAGAFRESFLELGGSVLRTLSYEPGTTYFEELLETVRFLRPQALVLPVPAEDVQALAPQISFFGLDTLGVRLLGTGDWTSEPVLRDLAPRHTNGVIVATPQPPGRVLEGYERFVDAYEERFQRSLVDTEIRALGYDAASLLLQALRLGARSPSEVRAALEGVTDFPGATGTLSIRAGRVVREQHLACLQDGALRPVELGERPVAYRPERRGDPELDEPEVVPLGPMLVYCPGVPVPVVTGGDRSRPPG